MSITIHDLPDYTPPPIVTNEDITYSSYLAGGDVPANYLGAKEEVSRTGESTLVKNEKDKWLEEQKASYNKTTEEILSDPSIPEEIRVRVAQTYMSGGMPFTKSLKTKLQELIATNDYSSNPVDQEAQTKFTDSLYAREEVKQKDSQASGIASGIDKLKEKGVSFSLSNIGQVTLSLGTKALLAIPAGYAAALSLIVDREGKAATDALEKMMARSFDPKTDTAKELQEWVAGKLEVLDIPFQWLGDKTQAGALKLGASDEVSAFLASGVYSISGVVGPPVAYVGAVKTFTKLTQVKPGSPLSTIETASTATTSKVAAAAVASDNPLATEILGTTKVELVSTYTLSKIESDGDILPDMMDEINKLDREAQGLFDDTEFSPHVESVDKIVAERAVYTEVFDELEPHLLLSSSVLDIDADAQLFGRFGKDYEAFVTSGSEGLTGTAMFGRNSNFGWATEQQALDFMLELQIRAKDLPDPGTFKVVEKNGQNYIQWDFKTKLVPHEMVSFGPDTIKASFLGIDATTFANTNIGSWIFPAHTRLKGDIVAGSAATFLKEGKIEATFLNAQRAIVLGTDHPKELTAMVERASASGKKQEFVDFQETNQHLTKVQNQKLYSEYMGFRRIQEQLYRFADRSYVKKLNANNMQSLYDSEGNFITHATKPINSEPLTPKPVGVTKIWDMENKKVIDIPDVGDVVLLNTAIKDGSYILRYALVGTKTQFGPIRPGALNKIPEYVARNYKERYVVEREATEVFIDGTRAPKAELFKYNEAIAMAKTQKEAEKIAAGFAAREPGSSYKIRKEEKDIQDTILDDSKIYDKYQSATHKRGDRLPSLEGQAEILDFVSSQTKAIRSISKVTAWEDIMLARKEAWTKAFGAYTKDGMFPNQASGVVPKPGSKGMSRAEEKEFLAAQSVYKQLEREQLSTFQSDILWKTMLHKVADGFEKINLPQEILREWGDKGFIPLRASKALASNLYIHLRPMRQWVVQTQQINDLLFISPTFIRHLNDIPGLTSGLIFSRGPLSGIKSGIDHMAGKMNKEYAREIAALEEAGIAQAVDMNSYIHGMMKDATDSLVPPKVTTALGAVDRAADVTMKGVAIPGKVARQFGFDPAELTAQVTLWKFAKHRWQEANPGKNWDTTNHRAEIHKSQILLGNTPASRAGMMPWQDGLISGLTQFMGQPHRSMMQMFSSKELTAGERARLAGGRLVWYGIYGVPYGAKMGAYLEAQVEDDEQRKIIQQGQQGISNLIYNSLLQYMYDEDGAKQKSDSAFGKSLATVPDKLFAHDAIVTAYQVFSGEKTNLSLAPIKASGAIFDAVRTLKDTFDIKREGLIDETSWTKAVWGSVSFALGFSDYEKAILVASMTKQGKSSGYEQTRGEAMARLFGVPPTQEVLDRMVMVSQMDRAKHVKARAADIHERLIRLEKVTDAEGWKQQTDYWEALRSFNQTTEPAYAEEVLAQVLVLDKKRAGEGQESLVLNIFKRAGDKHDKYVTDMINAYEKSTDPVIITFIKDLKAEQEKNRIFMEGFNNGRN